MLNNKPLWGGSTGHRRWIPLTKASDTERRCFLWSAAQQTVEQTIETPLIWDAIAPIMTDSGIFLRVHVTGGNFHRFSNVADGQMPAVSAVQGGCEWVYILMRSRILLLPMGEMRSWRVVKKSSGCPQISWESCLPCLDTGNHFAYFLWARNPDLVKMCVARMLTHWGRDKLAANFLTTFFKTFSWMKYLNLDWNFTQLCF